MTSTSTLPTNGLPSAEALTDRMVDTVASHALDLATDVAVPAVKFAAIRFVRTRAKTLAIGLVLLIAVPVVVKKLRARGDSDSTSARAPESSDNPISDIPTVESRVS